MEVKVSTGKYVNWERSMKIFEKELLGWGYTRKEIHFLNREVVEFENNGSLRRSFKAKAKEALLNENKFLGYTYKGFLTEFEINNRQTRYSLSGYFEHMVPSDFKEMERWIRKWRYAYKGSQYSYYWFPRTHQLLLTKLQNEFRIKTAIDLSKRKINWRRIVLFEGED